MVAQNHYRHVLAGVVFVTVLCSSVLQAGDWASVKSTLTLELQREVELAEKLEGYGYGRSALHYYKKIYRTADLSSAQLIQFEEKMSALEDRLKQKNPPNPKLPDLEVMLHSEQLVALPDLDPHYASEKTMSNTDRVRPQEFPSNRINKKKWLMTTLAIVGVSWVAYKVNRHLRKKNPPPPNVIEISF